MLSENEVKELNDEIFTIQEQIRNLNKRKDEIKSTLLHNSSEIVKSRFPNLEYGDKVKVTRKNWWWNKVEEVTEILFFKGVWQGKYDWELTPNAMSWKFYQIKKDGTQSQRVVEYGDSCIVNIEKIEE